MDVSGQTVCTDHTTVREEALVFIGVEAGWALELVWMFGEEILVLFVPRFLNSKSSSMFPSHYTEYAATY
jgi:hypothetical protein